MEFFDIGEAKPPVDASDRVKAVFSAIRTARSAWSVGIDIEEAYTYAILAHSIITDGAERMWPDHWDKEPQRGDAAGGLIKAALMAYWRAIDGGAEGRASLPIDQALNTEELRAASDRLKAQRNHSVAHHGVASEAAPTWHDDHITVAIDRDLGKAALQYPWVRLRAPIQTIQDLAMLLDALQPAVHEWSKRAQRRAEAKIAWLARQGELPIILGKPFVPETFFKSLGSAQAAADYRAMAPKAISEMGFKIDLKSLKARPD